MNHRLKSVIDRYRKCPECRKVHLVDLHQFSKTGDTPLHLAAMNEALDDMKVLVTAGVPIDAKGRFGDTALHEASVRGHKNSVRKLLRLGADPTIKNDFGETALDLAELMGRNEVVRILKARADGRRS
jgi:ankyrin repeat protein